MGINTSDTNFNTMEKTGGTATVTLTATQIPAEYDEQLVRRLIEKVTVFDEKIMVEFKSGVEIDVEK